MAFLEEVNFFSINIHGERALIQGLANRLYRIRTTVRDAAALLRAS